ncbi:hypothetical protein NMG60_11003753 [Bertholletia excelsa]
MVPHEAGATVEAFWVSAHKLIPDKLKNIQVMTHLQKLRLRCILKSVSSDFTRNNHRLPSSRAAFWATRPCLCCVFQSLRFYRKENSVPIENDSNSKDALSSDSKNVVPVSRIVRREAQAALLEYLHSTRNLHFMDADYISRNSPHFVEKLLKNIKNETDIGRHLSRFLRYHPINEFEPFFESMGLRPSEYSPFLPRDLMFLSDDTMLLENYHVLCNYGIARKNIGKIYKEAVEIFKYDHGLLQLKLQAFEEMGLNRSAIIKFVSSSPDLLMGDKHREFHKVLKKFNSIGIEYTWIVGHVWEGNSYNWNHVLELLCLLSDMGFSEKQLGNLICRSPELLFEASGNTAFSLVVFLLKFGLTKDEIYSVFMLYPEGQVGKFFCNLRQCYCFLHDIEMEVQEIGKIVRSHPLLLGSCALKKLNSILKNLNTGKRRLCDLIKENPLMLKNLVRGSKIKCLPDSGEKQRSKMMRTMFLTGLGFVENSAEMPKALKEFRGLGWQLQERFECFVKVGISRKDVSKMVKIAPQILNQSKDVIEKKIDFLVNGLGYPASYLVAIPACLSYTIQRVKCRFSMYTWLRDEGKAKDNLSLSTIVSCSEKIFMKRYVNQHPKGPEVWQQLKKQIYSS